MSHSESAGLLFDCSTLRLGYGMQDDLSVAESLRRWELGDESAADELYARYVERLRRLAESRLSARVKQRVDADDIVQTVFRTFFRRGRDGEFHVSESGTLWRLLAAITVNKVRMKVRYEGRSRRDYRVECPLDGVSDDGAVPLPVESFAVNPSDEEAVVVTDLLENVMRGLTERESRIIGLFAEGHSRSEIADLAGTTRRTVQRVIDRVAERLRREVEE